MRCMLNVKTPLSLLRQISLYVGEVHRRLLLQQNERHPVVAGAAHRQWLQVVSDDVAAADVVAFDVGSVEIILLTYDGVHVMIK